MKSKFVALTLASIISISAVESAHAQNLVSGVRANTDIEIETQANIDHDDTNMHASTSATVKGNATSSMNKNKDDDDASMAHRNATSTANDDSDNDRITSESHRSVVATFVHSLLAVADREGGIGAQVRTVAQSQNDSASTTVTAMTKVDERGSFHIFLTGSDYKNLGVIRSEIATTSANIAKLKVLLSQTKSDMDRAELNVQIKALEDEQVKIEAYVKTNENKFSLFGWLNRLFVK